MGKGAFESAEYSPREVLSPRARAVMRTIGQVLRDALEDELSEARELARPKHDRIEAQGPEAQYLRNARALLGTTGRAAMLSALQARSTGKRS
jgi:hypothetical protein